ncbi:hypothetical protein HMI54_009560 [Coelomomyces lativittatus]|nr:hypothetical protein HMI56_000265 [Coelomomyces lativittatus]KAJ1517845.1 hypothetical protein HMI55_005593 [Coelomomyces lativittatus]KAJ1518732.1 hypothetical protein HMI54_009560 [Coelomomyces lativittatus]
MSGASSLSQLPRRLPAHLRPHRYVRTIELSNGSTIQTWSVAPFPTYLKSAKDTYNHPMYAHAAGYVPDEDTKSSLFQSKYKLSSTWQPMDYQVLDMELVQKRNRKKKDKDQDPSVDANTMDN